MRVFLCVGFVFSVFLFGCGEKEKTSEIEKNKKPVIISEQHVPKLEVNDIVGDAVNPEDYFSLGWHRYNEKDLGAWSLADTNAILSIQENQKITSISFDLWPLVHDGVAYVDEITILINDNVVEEIAMPKQKKHISFGETEIDTYCGVDCTNAKIDIRIVGGGMPSALWESKDERSLGVKLHNIKIVYEKSSLKIR